ncbi:MAG: type II toxin-antitoxin system RelE/ParE family toxin [Clostridia bacterium]|nr:type II toxin-antitoxin system RelE/ParE family toxin [Clostridia bacterium]
MKNYIIIYKILDETIEILRILSQKTNYLSQENKNEILNRK